MLVDLALKCGRDGFNLLFTELVLHPADDDLGGEVSKRDDVVFRSFQADRAVSTSRVGAVVGIYGVVGSKNNPVSGVTLKLGNVPDRGGSGRQSGGSHGMISDGDSVPELGVEVSKVTGPSWCEHPDPEEKGTCGLR